MGPTCGSARARLHESQSWTTLQHRSSRCFSTDDLSLMQAFLCSSLENLNFELGSSDPLKKIHIHKLQKLTVRFDKEELKELTNLWMSSELSCTVRNGLIKNWILVGNTEAHYSVFRPAHCWGGSHTCSITHTSTKKSSDGCEVMDVSACSCCRTRHVCHLFHLQDQTLLKSKMKKSLLKTLWFI